MTVLRIALVVGLAALLLAAIATVDHQHKARGGIRRAGGRVVLRAWPSLGVHRVRRGRLRGALGAAGARLPGHVLRARCGGGRAGGGRAAAPSEVSSAPAAGASKKGYPARGCAPRPAARVACSRRLVVDGRVVGEAALPGRAHSSPQSAPAGLAPSGSMKWVYEDAPPLRPRDRPGSKVGGAMRVRTLLCAEPPLRCRQIWQVHVQNATRNQGGSTRDPLSGIRRGGRVSSVS